MDARANSVLALLAVAVLGPRCGSVTEADLAFGCPAGFARTGDRCLSTDGEAPNLDSVERALDAVAGDDAGVGPAEVTVITYELSVDSSEADSTVAATDGGADVVAGPDGSSAADSGGDAPAAGDSNSEVAVDAFDSAVGAVDTVALADSAKTDAVADSLADAKGETAQATDSTADLGLDSSTIPMADGATETTVVSDSAPIADSKADASGDGITDIAADGSTDGKIDTAGPQCAACDDNNSCTVGDCALPAASCSGQPAVDGAACSDGNACTGGETCIASACTAGIAIVCNDNKLCTDDSCQPAKGCVFSPNASACSDNNKCTVGDHCTKGTCGFVSVLACTDGNGCTVDSCDAGKGCQSVDATTACELGSLCFPGNCKSGVCVAAPPLDCNDGNPCTADACNVLVGCLKAPTTAPCEDGDKCTGGDSCAEGKCTSGKPIGCNDGNVCTDDSCQPATGCAHSANSAKCDDTDPCTLGDVCKNSLCTGPQTLDCNDANQCTDDSCIQFVGCAHLANSEPCNDGDACSVGEACDGKTCKPLAQASCSDTNPCTDDGCSSTVGCKITFNKAACTDGNSCTTGDTCGKGACVPGTVAVCDDSNPCTVDSCDKALGCKNLAGNNGSGCGPGKVCLGGACQ